MALKIGLVNPGTSNDGVIGMKISNALRFITNDTERMKITNDGHFLHGKTGKDYSTAGTHFYPNGEVNVVKSGLPLYVNRLSSNGTVIAIAKDSVTQGSIDVSGTTVTYNGGHLGRWSQATDGNRIDGLVKGTVMTNSTKWRCGHTTKCFGQRKMICQMVYLWVMFAKLLIQKTMNSLTVWLYRLLKVTQMSLVVLLNGMKMTKFIPMT